MSFCEHGNKLMRSSVRSGNFGHGSKRMCSSVRSGNLGRGKKRMCSSVRSGDCGHGNKRVDSDPASSNMSAGVQGTSFTLREFWLQHSEIARMPDRASRTRRNNIIGTVTASARYVDLFAGQRFIASARYVDLFAGQCFIACARYVDLFAGL